MTPTVSLYDDFVKEYLNAKCPDWEAYNKATVDVQHINTCFESSSNTPSKCSTWKDNYVKNKSPCKFDGTFNKDLAMMSVGTKDWTDALKVCKSSAVSGTDSLYGGIWRNLVSCHY